MSSAQELIFPPRMHNAEGKQRRLGIELEMNGLTLDQLAQLVADFFGGEIRNKGRYERLVSGDDAGDWTVELDFALLKKMGREERDTETLIGEIEQSTEDVLAWLAETVVPVELVSPPIPFERLGEMEKLITLLRDNGALGTSDKITNAFGLHLNPEAPGLEANIITAILKAFFCLYDWLHQRAAIDMTRRVTTYIDPFPRAYVRKVLAADYWPSQSELIDDYLKHNPTRNRALDMLPMFAHLDEARVRLATDDPRIKARPAFHYRLPNCDIHESDWGLNNAWNDWVMVERLANSGAWLDQCCNTYLKHMANPIDRLIGNWHDQVEERWLHNL